MKTKMDYVTNSSSTSFIIDVTVDKLEAIDFVYELYKIGAFDEFEKEYGEAEPISGDVLASLQHDYVGEFPLYKGEYKIVFGNEQDTVAGRVLEMVLKEEWSCESFEVKVHESLH